MDQTALFRACVKAMKIRKKHLLSSQTQQPRTPHIELEFSVNSRKLVSLITELREFLISQRKDYINSCHVVNQYSRLTDFDRDKIDSDAEAAIKNCSQLLKHLSKLAESQASQGGSQVRQHCVAVTGIVEVYLKAVCRIYSEQRAIRVKKAADMKRINPAISNWFRSRLSALLRSPILPSVPSTTKQSVEPDNTSDNEAFVDANPTVSETATAAQTLRHRKLAHAKTTKSNLDQDEPASSGKKSSTLTVTELDRCYTEQNLTSEEQDKFLAENEQLYRQFNTMSDDIEQIEGKVVEIARLQEVFTGKVLEQDANIYHIQETAVHSTENVKYGNEQIREAMQRQASMRVWVMFFLLVLTFTLWFLHWYNP